jgi:hypothetical protein
MVLKEVNYGSILVVELTAGSLILVTVLSVEGELARISK